MTEFTPTTPRLERASRQPEEYDDDEIEGRRAGERREKPASNLGLWIGPSGGGVALALGLLVVGFLSLSARGDGEGQVEVKVREEVAAADIKATMLAAESCSGQSRAGRQD